MFLLLSPTRKMEWWGAKRVEVNGLHHSIKTPAQRVQLFSINLRKRIELIYTSSNFPYAFQRHRILASSHVYNSGQYATANVRGNSCTNKSSPCLDLIMLCCSTASRLPSSRGAGVPAKQFSRLLFSDSVTAAVAVRTSSCSVSLARGLLFPQLQHQQASLS